MVKLILRVSALTKYSHLYSPQNSGNHPFFAFHIKVLVKQKQVGVSFHHTAKKHGFRSAMEGEGGAVLYLFRLTYRKRCQGPGRAGPVRSRRVLYFAQQTSSMLLSLRTGNDCL